MVSDWKRRIHFVVGWFAGRRRDARSGVDLYWGRRPEITMDAVATAAKMTMEQGTPLEIADRRRGEGAAR